MTYHTDVIFGPSSLQPTFPRGTRKRGFCLHRPGSPGRRRKVKPYAEQAPDGEPARRGGGRAARGPASRLPTSPPRGTSAQPSAPLPDSSGRMTDAPLAIPQATLSALRATRYRDGCRGTKIRLAGCEQSQLLCLMPSICDGGDRY